MKTILLAIWFLSMCISVLGSILILIHIIYMIYQKQPFNLATAVIPFIYISLIGMWSQIKEKKDAE
jgi:lipid-A-disaccharide synthase-like uncharacterized protein